MGVFSGPYDDVMSIHPATDTECHHICKQLPVQKIHVQLHSLAGDACKCETHLVLFV
jgi:hypothetical protein